MGILMLVGLQVYELIFFQKFLPPKVVTTIIEVEKSLAPCAFNKESDFDLFIP